MLEDYKPMTTEFLLEHGVGWDFTSGNKIYLVGDKWKYLHPQHGETDVPYMKLENGEIENGVIRKTSS